MQVFTLQSNIAFHLRLIWLRTLIVIDSEPCQRLFPTFCAQPSEKSVLFDWNLSRRPFLGQLINLDLLLNTGLDLKHADLFLCLIFYSKKHELLKD